MIIATKRNQATAVLVGLLSIAGIVRAEPLREVDLASDTAWTLRIDGGPPRAIRVPGGGWNSDLQSPMIDTMAGVENRTPLVWVLSHMFNHQTHHRGQVHTLLTGLVGEAPELDLLLFQRLSAGSAGRKP